MPQMAWAKRTFFNSCFIIKMKGIWLQIGASFFIGKPGKTNCGFPRGFSLKSVKQGRPSRNPMETRFEVNRTLSTMRSLLGLGSRTIARRLHRPQETWVSARYWVYKHIYIHTYIHIYIYICIYIYVCMWSALRGSSFC